MTKLTQEIVRELLDYDAETGVCLWKARDVKWFTSNRYFSAEGMCQRWNAKNAGKKIDSKNKLNYIRISIFGQRFLLHRVIWLWVTGEWPKIIDHENGEPSDNRWCNLRSVTRAENQKNLKLNKENKSGYPGVLFVSELGKWRVRIHVNCQDIHIGVFECVKDAIQARKEAEIFYNFHENNGKR